MPKKLPTHTDDGTPIVNVTLSEIRKKKTTKGLVRIPQAVERSKCYAEAAKIIGEREALALPYHGGRMWKCEVKLTDPTGTSGTNDPSKPSTTSTKKGGITPLFRWYRHQLQLATLPHILEDVQYVSHQMSHKKKWMHLSNDDEDSSDEEWEEPEPETVVFDISTLTTSAYEDTFHPIPVVSRSWISPDLVRFHSRKSAMAYAQTLVQRDVLIDRTLYGIGKNGIRLRPVKPTRKAALEAGMARFLRDGVWVVGQEEMWLEKRRERFNRKCLGRDGGDPPWRTCGHEFLSRRVRWTPGKGRGLRCQPAVGKVMGWISKSDVDSRGHPGFVSSKTGEPADLFHVEFEEYEQDFEEYELNEIWIDSAPYGEVLEENLNSSVNVQESCSEETSNVTSQNSSHQLSGSNTSCIENVNETTKQHNMTQNIMACSVSHTSNSFFSQKNTLPTIAVSAAAVCPSISTINPGVTGVATHNKNAIEHDLALPNTSTVSDIAYRVKANNLGLDEKEAANKTDSPAFSSHDANGTGVIDVSAHNKNTTAHDSASQNTSTVLDTTTCTAAAIGSGLDQKHAPNEAQVKQPDLNRLEAIVNSNVTIKSSVKVTVKQSTDANVETSESKTITPHDSDASTNEERKTVTKPRARRSYIEPLPPSTHYRLNPKQIKKCFSACIEHYENVMFTVKARSLHHELADGFDVLRERGKGRYDMELPQFDTEEYSFLTDPKKAAWLPIIHKILGDDAILVHKGCFLSLPGSETQVYHQDGVHLHKKVQKPCHAVNVFIPLVDYDMSNGPTEFCLGSHYLGHENFVKEMAYTPLVEAGTPVIFDYRLGHRGLRNYSQNCRPVVYLTYSSVASGKEFRDEVNFSRKRYRKLGDFAEKHLSRDERAKKRRVWTGGD